MLIQYNISEVFSATEYEDSTSVTEYEELIQNTIKNKKNKKKHLDARLISWLKMYL